MFSEVFLTALLETIIPKKHIAKYNLKKINEGKVQLHTVQIDNPLNELTKIFAFPLSY